MAKGPMWFAFQTVKLNLSANEGLRQLREAGMGVRRETWLRMVGEARAQYGSLATEFVRNLNMVPRPQEVATITQTKVTGYLQYVDVWVRNKTTGEIYVRPQTFRTDSLISRDRAIDFITSRYETAVDRSKVAPSLWGTDPDEVVLGGIYRGTQQFSPETE